MSLTHDFVYVNPNEATGGCGCLATGETGSEDCEGPWIVFPLTDAASNISPHSVLCVHHYREIALPGEADVIDVDAEEIPQI